MFANRHRGRTFEGLPEHIPTPSINVEAVRELLANCPAHAATPLVGTRELAQIVGIAALHIKDERGRMGLGSFKALGAAYVIACQAAASGKEELATALEGQTFVTASAGNHGMSVAAGARVFGATAVVYLSRTVPTSFAAKLEKKGAKVMIEGADYEASMEAAHNAAAKNGWHLLSDSSWEGYTEPPHRLMEGYLQMADEAFEALLEPPTHIMLQAGVGGLAGAVAALARAYFGETPSIIVVEPEAAPALIESVKAGKPIVTNGPVSNMGRLDCKEPSLIALKGLARDANYFVTISDHEAAAALPVLEKANLASTHSGGAGIAALMAASEADRTTLGLNQNSQVLCFLSEEPAP
ncbi:MAG: diaminopropionate ammonia-lyase [Pseudomonadota bacterium]